MTAKDAPNYRAILERLREERARLRSWCDYVVAWLAEDRVVGRALEPILVRGRLKRPARLRAKVERKHSPPDRRITRNNLLDEIEDLAGVRLVLAHKGQIQVAVDRVRELERSGAWDIHDEHHYVWHPAELKEVRGAGLSPSTKSFPYCSRHLILKPPGSDADSPGLVKCELQIRTILEEAIFENDHRLRYSGSDAAVFGPELGALVELLEVCDARLAELYAKG